MKRRLPIVVETLPERPKIRGDCELPRGQRPCAWISCRFNLLSAEIGFSQRIVIADRSLPANASDAEIDHVVDALVDRLYRSDSCALDVADRAPDGATLDQIGNVLGVTRERVRQIETKALRRMPRAATRQLGVNRADLHASSLSPKPEAWRRRD